MNAQDRVFCWLSGQRAAALAPTPTRAQPSSPGSRSPPAPAPSAALLGAAPARHGLCTRWLRAQPVPAGHRSAAARDGSQAGTGHSRLPRVGTRFVYPELGLGPGGLRAQCANTAERRLPSKHVPFLLLLGARDKVGVKGAGRKEVVVMWHRAILPGDNPQDKGKQPQVVPAEV